MAYIPSYRDLWRQERRLHRGPAKWLPNGLPVRGLLYFIGIGLIVLVADRLPVTHQILSLLAPVMKLGFLPAAAAYVAFTTRVDGRNAHHAAGAWLARRMRPDRTSNGEKLLLDGEKVEKGFDLKHRADENGVDLPKVRLNGPLSLEFSRGVSYRLGWRRRWVVREGGDVHGHDLAHGERVVVKP